MTYKSEIKVNVGQPQDIDKNCRVSVTAEDGSVIRCYLGDLKRDSVQDLRWLNDSWACYGDVNPNHKKKLWEMR